MDYFKLYLNTLLHDPRSTLFMLVKRPHIDQSLKDNIPSKNTYKNYDEWFYERKKNSEKIHPKVYLEETYFYKFIKAYNWIVANDDATKFLNGWYEEKKKVKELTLDQWYSITMFDYTKGDRKFSIFMNNVVYDGGPYIEHFYILCYTTGCSESRDHGYIYEEVISSTLNLNHGAHDINHYHLMPSLILDDNLNKGLTDLLENYNYVFKYGELRPGYAPLFRRGKNELLRRAYLRYSTNSSSSGITAPTIYNIFKTISKISNKIIHDIDNEDSAR